MDTPLENSFANEQQENNQDPHAQDDKAKHHDERSTFDSFLQEIHKMIREVNCISIFLPYDFPSHSTRVAPKKPSTNSTSSSKRTSPWESSKN